jgi:DNA-binding CsgD family transcriptional regulator
MKIFGLLSFSELRIASMIMSGLTSQRIANQLYISLRTVETHRKNIRRKLNINNSHQKLRDYLESRMTKDQYIFD